MRKAQNKQTEITLIVFHQGLEAFDMLSIICGAALLVATSIFYWYLLPRNGQENPLVKNSDVGSMVTIAIMAAFTFGAALLLNGLFS
jgi:cytosine/uracil/thiamine/allantoin permease